jgi:hypothetical protein
MGAPYKDISPDQMNERAWEYVNICIESTKEIATTAGVKKVKERHLPTIAYFLNIWLPMQDYETYSRAQFYNIIKDKDHPLFDTIKSIDEIFTSLATDIVANEGKGIFYAKNKLGMSDRVEQKTENTHVLSGKLGVNVVTSGIPLANNESDVDAT